MQRVKHDQIDVESNIFEDAIDQFNWSWLSIVYHFPTPFPTDHFTGSLPGFLVYPYGNNIRDASSLERFMNLI